MNYTHSHPDAAGDNGDDTASAGSELMFTVISAARAIEDRVEGALSELGLSLSKHTVLTKLVEAGEPLTLSEIAARLACVRSNVTQLIDRLEADGLVRRVEHASDRRSIRAELTDEGKERQAKGSAVLAEIATGFADGIGTGDRSVLLALLSKLA
ncbi:MAG: MarR family transcriptional regulator [Gemmatimonadaceae bacterium]